MRKRFFIILCFAAMALLATDPPFHVQVSAHTNPVELRAAEEVASYLSEVLQQSVAVEPETNRTSPVIYVGNTEFARAHGIESEKLEEEEFILQASEQHFIIAGGMPRGTLYGAFEFLERFAGVAWLDEFTTDIPHRKSITWPEKFILREKPVNRFREVYVNRCSIPTMRIAFKAHSRQNILWEEQDIEDLRKAWGLSKVFGTPGAIHTFYDYTKSWGPEMDDGFALSMGGSRPKATSSAGPGQVCFSDIRVREKIIAQMKEFIQADRKKNPLYPPVIYNLTMNDCREYCNCAQCLQRADKYGAYSGTVLEFWNTVAEAIGKEYPEIVIQGIAYLFTEKPPQNIIPAKNLSIVIAVSPWSEARCSTMMPLVTPVNQKSLANLKQWRTMGGTGAIWSYWITYDSNVSCNTGFVPIPTIVENMKLFEQLGVNYIFAECERPDTASFHSLRVFIGSKLMWNPTQPIEPLLDRFFAGYYGAAAAPMRRLYDEIIRRQKENEFLDVPSASALQYLDEALFRLAHQCLDEAEAAVRDDAMRLFNVHREFVTMDIARLSRRQVVDAEGMLTRDQVLRRLKKLWPQIIAKYYVGEKWSSGANATMKDFIKSAESIESIEPGLKHPLDLPGFENCVVFDLDWHNFNAIENMAHYGLKIVDDPEAVGGKAMAIDDPRDGTDGTEFHAVAYRCGIYIDGKDVTNQYYHKPANENYQWLKLDKTVELSPSTLLWLHNSWRMQQQLDGLYRPGENNRAQIYFSVKRQGPAYFPQSKLPNALRVDRILVKIID